MVIAENNTEMSATAIARQSGLPETAITAICNVLRQHSAVEEALLYGSRAKGNFRPASDIDLTLKGSGISWQEFQRIESEIDDLLLPWKTDLSVYHHIDNDDLKQHIARVGVRLF